MLTVCMLNFHFVSFITSYWDIELCNYRSSLIKVMLHILLHILLTFCNFIHCVFRCIAIDVSKTVRNGLELAISLLHAKNLCYMYYQEIIFMKYVQNWQRTISPLHTNKFKLNIVINLFLWNTEKKWFGREQFLFCILINLF